MTEYKARIEARACERWAVGPGGPRAESYQELVDIARELLTQVEGEAADADKYCKECVRLEEERDRLREGIDRVLNYKPTFHDADDYEHIAAMLRNLLNA